MSGTYHGYATYPGWPEGGETGWDYAPHGGITLDVSLVDPSAPTLDAIDYSPAKPVTGETITFDARIAAKPGYEVSRTRWLLLRKQNGNPGVPAGSAEGPSTAWKVTLPKSGDTYGDYTVICMAWARKNGAGDEVPIGIQSRDLKVFFKLWEFQQGAGIPADDDPSRNDGPNWFEYWQKDGAVPDLAGFQYVSGGKGYGMSLGNNAFEIYDAAAGIHYTRAIPVPGTGESFGGTGAEKAEGIDCAAEVVAHERQHQAQANAVRGQPDSDRWVKSTPGQLEGGDWYYPGDPCPDGLSDAYESSTSHTNRTNPDTWDLAIYKSSVYAFYGDAELDAMRTAEGKKGIAARDWSDSGKQASMTSSLTAGPAVNAVGGILPAAESDGAFNASIASPPTATGVDLNGNGLYDLYRVDVPVRANRAGEVGLGAELRTASGQLVATSAGGGAVTAGTTAPSLNLDGAAIGRAGVSGPCVLTVSLSDMEGDWLFDTATVAIPSLSAGQFEGSQVALTGAYSDRGVDADGDGVLDAIEVTAGLTVARAGTYTVLGALSAGNGTVATASAPVGPGTGAHTVALRFPGTAIAASRQNGPYQLQSVAVVDDRGVTLGYADAPYSTHTYAWTQFQPNALAFMSAFREEVKDTDYDGEYNTLTIGIDVNVTGPGIYTFTGVLANGTGRTITESSQRVNLSAGLHTVPFSFDGNAIYSKRLNGPYRLLTLVAYDATGGIVATGTNDGTTTTYSYTQFEHPFIFVWVVPPSGELPADLDGDGLYEDVNGNGREDFVDVVLYFNQMAWISANEPLSAFDYNGNGRIDFADVVWLFTRL